MADKEERRVYYADCYCLNTAGCQGYRHHRDHSKCVLQRDSGELKHPDLNITGCTRGCSDYRDGEGRHF